MPQNRTVPALSFCLAGLLAASASAAVLRNEATGGDLSNNRNAPTAFTLAIGTNEVIATSGPGDLEYFTLTVPADQQLRHLYLRSYSGNDGTAFIGVQRGSTFTEDASFPDQANLLGYSHFGPDRGQVGTDILPAVGQGGGSQRFTPPLGPGQYTFWAQQTGAATTYRLDFVTVPEPGVAVLLTGVAIMGLFRRR